jgi:hypothetical protein
MTVESQRETSGSSADGIIAFNRIEHALKAEKFLKAAGIYARVVVPPHQPDTGCNLGLLFDLAKRLEVECVLKEKKSEYTYIGAMGDCGTDS